MSFVAIHIPEFPIAAWLRNDSHLKGLPLALLKGTPPQETVASLDAVAQAAGIKHGMSKAQAEAACAACVRSRIPEEEAQAFKAVLELADRFSPRIQVISAPENLYAEQDQLAAALLLDSSGTGSLFGAVQIYTQCLYDELLSKGFAGSVVSAPNAHAALMLSRSLHGVLCVKQGDVRERLAQLPTLLLPCEPRTTALLHRWGVHTLGQLAALPEAGLASRLGQSGLRLLQLARGEAAYLFTPKEPEFLLAESLDLETPAGDLERLLFVLSQLLGNIIDKAVNYGYAVRCLTVTFAFERAPVQLLRVASACPTQNRQTLLKLLNLELQAHPLQAEVVALRVEADTAQPQNVQRGLFQSQFLDPDRLDLLLARLRAIAGEHNVGSANLENSHREDAFTLETFRPELDGTQTEGGILARPALRMIRPSQSVCVWLVNERPHSFSWRGSRYNVAEAAGPWHASGSWWGRTNFDCDYWDVITEEPAYMLRLQQEHAAKTWNVVGLYD